ncbi:MAG: chromosome segregation protein SMC [Candidatus Bruticola sp.]
MFLKRLELCGFKTFADKTELEFIPGLMAIVGPNGSGKSNLTDAVRYVLGEQSAKTLRASKQEELIFAGSPERRPAQNCEVTVTFDNQDHSLPVDFSEVSLTRRVNRQGESQYFINQVACRLKDIQELLMGSGVGPGSFYILGAREVDMVLSSDPKDRRMMLEETAGTNRYRFRRREAMRKLEQTQQNLVRLRDLRKEVEDSTLESSRSLARYERYRQAQDDLRLCEARLAWSQYRRAERLFQESEYLVIELQANSQKADSEQVRLLSQTEELQKIQNERRANRDRLHQQNADLKAELSFARASQDGLSRRLAQLSVDSQAAAEHSQHLWARYAHGAKELAQLEAQLPDLRLNLEAAQKNCAQVRQSLEELPFEADSQGQNCREALITNEQRQKELRIQVEVLKEDSRRGELRLQTAERELETVKDVPEEFQRLMEKRQELQDRCCSTAEARKRASALLQEKRVALSALRSKRTELERRRRPLHAKVMELEAVLEERIGMPMPVKAVMKWRESGTVGVIGELVKVHEGMETALEVALGGRVNDIIVRDRSVASALVDRLKQERIGRATFWPLDLQRRESELIPLPTRQGVVGYALELIDFAPELRPVLSQILGQTLVVQDLASALTLYDRFKGRRPHLVTLQGEFLSAVGAVTGGISRSEKTGVFVRMRACEEAKNSLNSLEQSLSELSTNEEKLERLLRAAESEVALTSEEERLAKQALADLEAENKRAELEQLRLQKLRTRLHSEIEFISNNLAGSRKKLQSSQKELESLAQEWISLNERLSLSLEQEARLTAQRAALRVRLAEEQIKIEAAEHSLASGEREVSAHKKRLRELNEDAQRAESEERRLVITREQAKTEGNDLVRTIAEKQERLQKTSQELEEAVRILETENEKLLQMRQEQLKAVRLARELGEALSSAQVNKETCQSRFRNEQKRWQEYADSGFDTQDEQFSSINAAEVSNQAAKLRRFLENFGSVNLGARQEYERLKARLDDLTSQVTDLERASEGFQRIVEEMDQALVAKFKQVFNQVNHTFASIFQNIFGGGFAKLELCNPDDWLESGVDICACPPGKKLQNLTLFSSGERALSAISFLFALLTHKPSPVVIFDELDAPLDDANVEKIAGKLLDFATSSQFLIVTHNRKTMEFAQRLYGVTMDKPGISRLLSVEMENPAAAESLSN